MKSDALAFMKGHANKACAGRIRETFAEATPEAIEQARVLMTGFPYPPKANTVVAGGADGDDYVFDVAYTGDGGATVALRELVRKNADVGPARERRRISLGAGVRAALRRASPRGCGDVAAVRRGDGRARDDHARLPGPH